MKHQCGGGSSTGSRHRFNALGRISPYFEGVEQAGGCSYDKQLNSYVPWSYPIDPAEQYRAVTEAVTLWDTASERQIELRGPDALRLADMAVTRDLTRLAVEQCCYAFVCGPSGTVICDPIVMKLAPDQIWISVAGTDLELWLGGLAIGYGFDVTICELEVAPLQLQGPRSAEVLETLCGPSLRELGFFRCMRTTVADIDAVVSRTGWSGELGYEIYPEGTSPYPRGRETAMRLWNALLDAGRDAGLLVTPYALDRALECGFMVFNHGTGEDMNALEFWRTNMVDFDGGDFIGKRALLALRDSGGPPRAMMGLIAVSEDARILPGEWDLRVLKDDEEIGHVRRVGYSYGRRRAIAAGLLRNDAFQLGDPVEIVHPAGRTEVRIETLPFLASRAGRQQR